MGGDRRDVRGLIKPIYSITDLMFVPAGVLAAVLYNTEGTATFALFMALVAVFVLSLNGIGRALTTEDAERSPIARLFNAGRALYGARRGEELGLRVLAEMRWPAAPDQSGGDTRFQREPRLQDRAL